MVVEVLLSFGIVVVVMFEELLGALGLVAGGTKILSFRR